MAYGGSARLRWGRPARGLAAGPARGRARDTRAGGFNDVFAEAEVHDHGGDAWYETLVGRPRDGRASGSCCGSD